MATGSVLTQLYVDLIMRNVDQAGKQLRQVQGQADATAASFKRMKEAIANAGPSGGGLSGLNTLRAAGPGGGAGGVAEAVAGARRSATRAAGADLSQVGAGAIRGFASGNPLGALQGALQALPNVTGPAAVGLAAVGSALALVVMGLQGTTELEQFGQAMLQVAREAAALAAPLVTLATDVLRGAVSMFRELGGAGQMLLGRFMPLVFVLNLLADPGVKQAFGELAVALGQVWQAMEPVRNIFLNVGVFVMKVVAGAITLVANGLTYLALIMKRVAEAVMPLVRGLAGLLGLGGMLEKPGVDARRVTLNQTGTEDANGTFQRIQQAVLRMGRGEENKQEGYLDEINKKMTDVANFCNAAIKVLPAAGAGAAALGAQLAQVPGQFAEGSKPLVAPGLALLAGLLGR